MEFPEPRSTSQDARMVRILRAMRSCTRLLARASGEQELLSRVCEVVVDTGGYRMAWVGLKEYDEARTVRPAAVAGYDAGYLETVRVAWSESDRGSGPVGIACREGKTVIIRSVEDDPRFDLWKLPALKRGYRSVIALPIMVRSDLVGCLAIYSAERDAFDEEEALFLRELAEDLGSAMAGRRDQAERSRFERELAESEEQLHAVFDQAPIGMALTTLDGRIVRANARLAKMARCQVEDLVGKTGPELTHPDDAPDPEKLAAMLRGESEMTGIQQRMFRHDGSTIWCDVATFMLRDRSGKPVSAMVHVRDISDRKEAEVALREAEEALRVTNETLTSILDASPLAVVAVDRQKRVILWKGAAQQLFGWTEEEVLGRTPPPFVPVEEHATFEAIVASVFAGRRFSNVEQRSVRKDGRAFPVAISTSAVRDRDGNVTAALGMFIDLTESKRLEAQLQHAVKMEAIGRLAGGVAHDFNNLIMVIMANAGVMASDLPPDHPLRQNVDEIRAATERTAALTKQLLAFSRRQIMQARPLNLNSVVGDIERLLRRIMGEDVETVLKLDPGLGSVLADPDQLSQVLLNLAVNARDAMPRGGRLSIETVNVQIDASYAAQHVDLRPGPYVKLSVSDSGIGMTAEVRERLFEPFFTTKERGRGTGLGLSTVYGIVRQSAGSISVYSEPGLGSTFNVFLPRHDRAASQPEAARQQPPRARGNGERILLVEDEPGVRGVVQRSLERANYRVTVAASPEEALRLLPELDGPFPLVITDMVMPGMGGVEMAALIQTEWPGVRLLFMSGYTEPSLVGQTPAALESAFLQKPFGLDSLLAKVRELLDRDGAK